MSAVLDHRLTYDHHLASLPLPDVEDLSDSDGSDYESLTDVSITTPIKAFFLGCRQSQILDPKALEAGLGRSLSKSSSMATLVVEDDVDEKPIKPRPTSSLPRDSIPLPPKKGVRAYRYLRWNFGSVYRRIFTLAFVGNLVAIAVLVIQTLLGGPQLTQSAAACAVAANLLAATVIRNEHVVNAMFAVFGTWPRRLPLCLRRLFAKVYSYGGIHSGCSVAATCWYVAFLVLLTREYLGPDLSALRGYIFLVSYAIVFLLITILIFAHPRIRVTIHNWFEGIHRFLGWTVIALFWAQVLLMTADAANTTHRPYGAVLVINPTFWMLLTITLLIIYPWTRLRLRDVEAEPLSDHCVKLNFDYRTAHYGQAIRLSDSPLRETHAFATIPHPAAPEPETPHCSGCACDRPLAKPQPHPLSHAGEKGFSVVISNAGDWTRKIIQNPPKKMYVRGVPTSGVLRVAGMFEPVIVMATGSGIAPCLSLFVERPDHPVRIIWSAPSPLQTFGQGVLDAVYRADPDAVVIDTRTAGRPDLVRIAYRMWEGSRHEAQREYALGRTGKRKPMGQCEAVVIISNQKVTRKVVYGLESRGVPAYGAIFDS